MIIRPSKVGDALTVADDGITEGKYGDCVLRPAYQPIYAPAGQSEFDLVGFEGLIRIQKQGEFVSPLEFFKTVQSQDRLFIECMCQALHIRNYHLIDPPGKKLFINVDVSVYESLEILEREVFYVFSQIEKHGLTRNTLIFEIVETEVLDHEILRRVCSMFRSNGFLYALDDFGTMHSNVERFLEVRPDIVKLDRSLIAGMDKVHQAQKLIQSLVNAFRETGTTVLIEGVERFDEVISASQMGVDLMQGYGLAIPQLAPMKFCQRVVTDGSNVSQEPSALSARA